MENEELDLNLDDLDQIEASADNKLKVKNRFQQLSDKVKSEAQEKEKAQAEAKANAERITALEKEAESLKTFSQLSSKYPEASNYQEQILERVNRGYDPEEATLAVLAKEGKLEQQAPLKPEGAEGGSAMTQIPEGDKTPGDMSASEKLEALQKLEKSGELIRAMKSGINTG
jgi:hypothetical protein